MPRVNSCVNSWVPLTHKARHRVESIEFINGAGRTSHTARTHLTVLWLYAASTLTNLLTNESVLRSPQALAEPLDNVSAHGLAMVAHKRHVLLTLDLPDLRTWLLAEMARALY